MTDVSKTIELKGTITRAMCCMYCDHYIWTPITNGKSAKICSFWNYPSACYEVCNEYCNIMTNKELNNVSNI